MEDLLERRAAGTVGRLRATSVKIMQDGVCENYTAAMLSPYRDAGGAVTSNAGLSMVEPSLLKQGLELKIGLFNEVVVVFVTWTNEDAVRT